MTRFEEKQNFCEDKEEALVWISDNFREFKVYSRSESETLWLPLWNLP